MHVLLILQTIKLCIRILYHHHLPQGEQYLLNNALLLKSEKFLVLELVSKKKFLSRSHLLRNQFQPSHYPPTIFGNQTHGKY